MRRQLRLFHFVHFALTALLTLGPGCASNPPPDLDGPGAAQPALSDSVLAWHPLQADDRAIVRLRGGRETVGVLVSANDSLLILELRPDIPSSIESPLDTLPRSEIETLRLRPEEASIGAALLAVPLGMLFGFGAGVAIAHLIGGR